MKNFQENRYAHSATLFHFCKEALNIKHNYEVKIIDQHVGAILGFDPADCSHWKKGKKNIRSIQTISTIAEHLEIDPRLITDIVSGQTDLEESLQEYRGYGSFLAPQTHNLTHGTEKDRIFSRDEIQKLVAEILRAADVRSTPVMIPEILPVLKNVTILEESPTNGELVSASFENGAHIIRVRKGDMRPHIRFLIAREIGRTFLYPTMQTDAHNSQVDLQLNTFAMLLLMPTTLLQIATREANNTRDLIQQLSNSFWLGRTAVNARIKDFFANGN